MSRWASSSLRREVGWAGSQNRFGPPMRRKKLVDPQALAEDFEAAKGKLPDQSHAMTDVAMQFSNLWFAAEKENWPLADFFWSETRSHLAWAVRIIPKRKDNAGRVVDLVAILQSLENSPLKQLGAAIKAKDHEAFVKAYRFTIEGCYACHKAADKPYIHPQIPTAPHADYQLRSTSRLAEVRGLRLQATGTRRRQRI